eukprot:2021300-Rhodomonas_salina.1
MRLQHSTHTYTRACMCVWTERRGTGERGWRGWRGEREEKDRREERGERRERGGRGEEEGKEGERRPGGALGSRVNGPYTCVQGRARVRV